MESASLRNSHQKGFDTKLRRIDQALHETVQHFVESLGKDVRISQYADPSFAAKKITEANQPHYWLQQQGRQGYLVFMPKQPIVWMDDQMKQSYRINMRVGHLVYEKKSVFIASLDRTNGLLRIEDVWMLCGNFLRNKPFTQRWEGCFDFYDRNYKPDPVLQQGLEISPALYEPLSAIEKWTEVPSFAYLQGETTPRRLRVQLILQEERKPTPTHPKPLLTLPPKPAQIVSVYSTSSLNQKEDLLVQNAGDAKAIAHPDYPDTYDIWINGVKKGYAAVQDLELSRRLRTKKEHAVKVEWNEEFEMYQILDIL